jgi:hypothetical protein
MNDATEEVLAGIETAVKEARRPKAQLVAVKSEATGLAEPSVDQVGQMAADAVQQVYEATAREVEVMAVEVKERIAKLSQALAEADADLKWIGEAAAAIRLKGTEVRATVERAAATSKSIRDACAHAQEQIDAAA